MGSGQEPKPGIRRFVDLGKERVLGDFTKPSPHTCAVGRLCAGGDAPTAFGDVVVQRRMQCYGITGVPVFGQYTHGEVGQCTAVARAPDAGSSSTHS